MDANAAPGGNIPQDREAPPHDDIPQGGEARPHGDSSPVAEAAPPYHGISPPAPPYGNIPRDGNNPAGSAAAADESVQLAVGIVRLVGELKTAWNDLIQIVGKICVLFLCIQVPGCRYLLRPRE